jgi:hypothetical protein
LVLIFFLRNDSIIRFDITRRLLEFASGEASAETAPLTKLSDEGGLKGKIKPTQAELIFQSRAVYRPLSKF